MVTVYGNRKQQAKAKSPRALLSVALLATALTGFAASADGLFLPDILTGAAKPVVQEVESEPVVQPAISSGLTAVAPASDAALTYEPEAELPTQVPVPSWRPAEEPRYQSDLPDDGDGAGTPKCTGNCKPSKNNGLAGQIADGKKAAGEVIAKAPVEEVKTQGASNLSNRLSQAAWAAAARCRDFANFKERRMGIAKYGTVRNKKGKKVRVQLSVTYNSCKFFGKENVFRSKGMCAAGVREAFADAGIRIAAADARNLRPNLARAGFKPVKYEPSKVKAGTVLVCNGGSSGFGHTEVVVENGGERWFCSDFCSRAPTCSKAKGYSNMTAYSLGI